ncbi:hypothetical protein Q5Y75_07935 [Ruegeria sp. 2205SS24-7]|uniref:hypothetical protein n=1 Tax=Ruegeria discodermiae TaxID=3064389 RepID=UPI002741B3B4|nr:hypothetical protein [Ruegeria sp. 2205SS24-7]MDP5217143.1 hypothetical protein [Ruegeria sp. 2205SS24-7]
MSSKKTKPADLVKAEAEQPGEESRPLAKFQGSEEKGHELELLHHRALRDVFGTDCEQQASDLMAHCLKALNSAESGGSGEVNDERTFMVSIIHDIGPRDAVERMLAVQMAATHVATIRSARWLACTETIPQAQLHYTGFNKLARTFAAQMEALRKHRNGGKQTVTVQHVNVEDGGQAIVGNVETGGRRDGR